MFLSQGDQLGMRLIGDRLPRPEDALPGADRVLDRVDAPAQLFSPGGGDELVEDDGGMVERAHQTPQRPLARSRGEVGSRGLGLLHEVGKGEDRIPGDDALGLTSPKGDVLARFAAYRPRIGHTALQSLSQEVGGHLLQLAALGGVRQVAGLLRAEPQPRPYRRLDGVGTPRLAGSFQLGEEPAG
jgi:hypothetical protein